MIALAKLTLYLLRLVPEFTVPPPPVMPVEVEALPALLAAGPEIVIGVLAVTLFILVFGLVPDVSIFGVHPFGFIIHMRDYLIRKVVGWLDAPFAAIENSLMATTVAQNHLNNALIQEAGKLSDSIKHLSHKTIPELRFAVEVGVVEYVGARLARVWQSIHALQHTAAHALNIGRGLEGPNGYERLGGLRHYVGHEVEKGVRTAEHYTRTHGYHLPKSLETAPPITLPAITGVTPAVNVAVPLAVAGLAGYVAKLGQDVEQCMVTRCAGPNNWQNLLKDLLGLGDLAAISALLYEMATEPEALARAVAPEVHDVFDVGDKVWSTLLDLRL